MKLSFMQIDGFRSVSSTLELHLDERVSVLIGPNDHGKSNLLAAVEHLNQDLPIQEDEANWDLADGKSPRLEWHFTLEQAEIDRFVSFADDYSKSVEAFETAAREASEASTVDGEEDGGEQEDEEDEEAQDGDDQAEVGEEVEDEAGSSPGEALPQGAKGELSVYREGVGTPLRILAAPLPVGAAQVPAILGLLPRVELFLPLPANLVDRVTHSDIDTADREFMRGIFRLAGIWESRESIFDANDTTGRKLDEGSTQLTAILNDEWNQGEGLEWKLSHYGRRGIQIQLKDPAVTSRYTRPSQKSSGFCSYFVLSMTILARTQAQPKQTFIFLFDEPGVHLHPRAQIDLLRAFEVTSDRAQIVYTTHSLFLVNKNYPDRNLVVTKSGQGTLLNRKPFTGNWRALRESLGLLAASNVLIADKTLVVEGPSDVVYLLLMIRSLKQAGKVDIDLDDFSVIDAGDESNMVAMVKLLVSEGRSIVSLNDGDSSGRKVSKRVERSVSAAAEQKLIRAACLGKDESIENLLGDVDLLDRAMHAVATDLIDRGARELATGLTREALEEQHLSIKAGETLGKTMRDTTKAWFADGDPISKLSIALKVEDLLGTEPLRVSKAGARFAKDLKLWLELRGERGHAVGVFEPVT